MSYQTPTLSELIAQGERLYLHQFPQSKRHSVLSVVNRVNAALSAGEHKHVDWLAKQIIPTTADEDYLLEYCAYKGIFRKPASVARGMIVLDVAFDTEIESGTSWEDSTTGLQFFAVATTQVAAGKAEIEIECDTSGTVGNLSAGTTLSLTNAVLGVQSDATVKTLSGGADLESLSSLLARLIYRVQYPPAGGADHDYVRWALECDGITRAWCYPRYMGGGTVGVAVVLDNQSNILPSQQDCDTVKNYLLGHKNSVTGLWEGAPAEAEIYVFAPKVRKLDLTIRLVPATTALKSAVKNALVSLCQSLDPGTLLYLSHLRATISNVVGETDNAVISLNSDIQLASDEILVLGEITWQA
ncbi:baseplate J/gp47 family protein [Mannheimia massilioguelmaensis]|uniref:baseplate J/gp47 family protein n=1 Tax=Mannheimia massilioguelmaensis TaxID=1604354 RepID=UPI0005C85A03|nr:baseplate J/gp47 family protein [Mannheimia massilioguelmaensis]